MSKKVKNIVTICRSNGATQSVIDKMISATTKIFGFCCVVDNKFRLVGVVNSGDILRDLSKNKTSSKVISNLMNKDPIFVREGYELKNVLEEISKKLIYKTNGNKKFTRFVPVLSKTNILIDVIDLYELIGSNPESKPTVAIYGMGYVGLTLATALSSLGIKVFGIDKDKKIIKNLSKGIVHIFEPRLDDMLKSSLKNKTLIFKDNTYISNVEFHIVTVGTPINKKNKPEINDLKLVCKMISNNMKPNSTIILRSTVPVGTTRKIVLPILSKSKLKIGESFFLSFCPERTVEGNAIQELFDIPQVIGGITEKCVEKSAFLFKFLAKSIVRADAIEGAELVKLLNNSFRDLSFSFSNAFIKLSEKFNIDANTIISIANEGYPRNKIPLASPGVGGYCLTKDPYLYSSIFPNSPHSSLSKLGRNINANSHKIVLEYVKKFVKINGLVKNNIKILIIGMAFKGFPETNDLRGSTSVQLYKDLIGLKFKTYCFDNIIEKHHLKNQGFKVLKTMKSLKEIDIFLFINNHPKNLFPNFFSNLSEKKRLLFFDGWNLLNKHEIETNSNWTYASLGYYTK